MTDKRTILIAGMGTSPAVLTETVWTLCHQKKPMLRQIRQYTESSDTVVLASIAGGRKTMSALLFSCMSLLGREDDKVFHVLLPPEFEGGVEPPMYYPVKGVTYTNIHTGKKYKSDKYHSELFEVPFVRMRGNPVTFPLGRIIMKEEGK